MSIRLQLIRNIALFGAAFALLSIVAVLQADDDHGKGKGGGGGHHGGGNRGGGSAQFLDVSPWGVSYGYQNRNFGISLGPFGGGQPGGGYGPPVVADPVIVSSPPIIYSEPMVGDYGYVPAAPRSVPSSGGAAGIESPIPGSTRYHPAAEPFYRQSVGAFRAGDYESASRLADHAIIEDATSGFLRLYASQCLVATETLDAAATALLDGLERTEQDQWGLEIKGFREIYKKNDYVAHVKQMERFAADRPEVAYANALCAYHFHYLGHKDAALRHLKKAQQVDPQDPLVLLLARAIPLESAEELPEPKSILNK